MPGWQGRIPLFVGVAGHRDLHPDDLPALRQRVGAWFTALRESLPATPIVVLTQLADGADRLVASIALESGCESACVVPQVTEPSARVSGGAAPSDYERLRAASARIELPDHVRADGSGEAAGAAAAHYIARHAGLLLALWDGSHSDRPGSVSEVVRARTSARIGTGVASVYHLEVRCSGTASPPAAAADQPEEGAAPGGLSRDLSAERIVAAHGLARLDAFNVAVQAAGARLDPMPVPPPFSEIPDPRVGDVARAYRAAADLAADAQRAERRRKLLLQVLAMLAAVSFVVIFKTNGERGLVWLYLALLAAVLVLRSRTKREAVHRRYLDYRCLAEGLRVVLYWRIAGVHWDAGSRAVTAPLIGSQDPSLSWISASLSGLDGWIGRVDTPAGFDGFAFAARHWIGADGAEDPGAQIPYYRRTARHRREVAAWLDRIAHGTLACGVATAAALAILPAAIVGQAGRVLLAVMGFLPLVSSTASATADVPAELEIARQCDAMALLLEGAGRRLASSTSDAERRHVLFEVGAAALAEHRIWHTVFRERAPENRIRA